MNKKYLALSICLLMFLTVTMSPLDKMTGPISDHDLPSEEWEKLLNKEAPNFDLKMWINSSPLNMEELKGKVVLIRWWLETCPYCKATAPSLNEFHEAYADDGLVIIGMYHPKPLGKKVTIDEVKTFSEVKQFEFPVAIDEKWGVLRSYWPRDIPMPFTSVSFLIDREGIIRFIHPGGSYSVMGQPFNDSQWKEDYHEVKQAIERLIE